MLLRWAQAAEPVSTELFMLSRSNESTSQKTTFRNNKRQHKTSLVPKPAAWWRHEPYAVSLITFRYYRPRICSRNVNNYGSFIHCGMTRWFASDISGVGFDPRLRQSTYRVFIFIYTPLLELFIESTVKPFSKSTDHETNIKWSI